MNIYADLSLIDLDDQGVCPEGDPCWLILNREGFWRTCGSDHDGPDVYVGPPLIDPYVTRLSVEYAVEAGASLYLVRWALDTLDDREDRT